jgi:hypothetical protein
VNYGPSIRSLRLVISSTFVACYPGMALGQLSGPSPGQAPVRDKAPPALVAQLGHSYFDASARFYALATSNQDAVFITLGSPALLWDARTGGQIRPIGTGAMRLASIVPGSGKAIAIMEPDRVCRCDLRTGATMDVMRLGDFSTSFLYAPSLDRAVVQSRSCQAVVVSLVAVAGLLRLCRPRRRARSVRCAHRQR